MCTKCCLCTVCLLADSQTRQQAEAAAPVSAAQIDRVKKPAAGSHAACPGELDLATTNASASWPCIAGWQLQDRVLTDQYCLGHLKYLLLVFCRLDHQYCPTQICFATVICPFCLYTAATHSPNTSAQQRQHDHNGFLLASQPVGTPALGSLGLRRKSKSFTAGSTS